MSICSKYNDEERKQLDKTQYMRMASYDDILQLTDIVFDVAALICKFCSNGTLILKSAVHPF